MSDLNIRTVGILGAGQMGLGIAQVATRAGFKTILVKMTPGSVENVRKRIETGFGKEVEKGRMTARARPGCPRQPGDDQRPRRPQGRRHRHRVDPRGPAHEARGFPAPRGHLQARGDLREQHLDARHHRDGGQDQSGPTASSACTSSIPQRP